MAKMTTAKPEKKISNALFIIVSPVIGEVKSLCSFKGLVILLVFKKYFELQSKIKLLGFQKNKC